MHLQISKVLFSILLFTTGLSILILLRPDISYTENKDLKAIELNQTNVVQLEDKQITDVTTQFTDLNNIWVRSTELEPYFAKKELPLKAVKKKIKPIVPQAPVYIPPPAQPSLPTPQFNYVGRMIDGNKETLFLIGPSGPFIAKLGDVIDGQWRIEHISANSIDMVYLNTNTNFRLNIK